MRRYLPRDELQVALEQETNAKLEPGCRVDMFSFRDVGGFGDENAPVQYGAVFSFGPRRKVVTQEEMFFDSDRVVKEFDAWRHQIEQERHRERYTPVPPEEWAP